jgi:hypothetical protein
VSNPTQARWIHQPGNVDLLAEQIAAAVIGNTTEADVIGLSIGHRFKHSHPNDMGAACALGDTEATHGTATAEAVAAKLTAAGATADIAPKAVPAPENPLLSSSLFQGNAILEAVAEGHLVLTATGGRVNGIERVQDALNQLGFTIILGHFRGFFGEKTESQIEAFQKSVSITVNGRVGQDTIRALDAALGKGGSGSGQPQRKFTVPPASAGVVSGIDFDSAVSVGDNFVKKFAIADKGGDPSQGIKDAHKDPSLCERVLQFADGTIFFSAKMAIDSDGSPRAGSMDDTGDPHTSQRYLDGTSVNAEEVPYFVLPQFDKFAKEDFISDLGLKLGDYGVIIHKDKITGAFVADEGPFFKIGEASIRVHELLEPPPAPWKTAAKKRIRDASVERDVLYFVFPRTVDMTGLTPANAEQKVIARATAFFDRFKKTGSHI